MEAGKQKLTLMKSDPILLFWVVGGLEIHVPGTMYLYSYSNWYLYHSSSPEKEGPMHHNASFLRASKLGITQPGPLTQTP